MFFYIYLQVVLNLHRMKKILLIFIICMISTSCAHVCIPSKKNVRYAQSNDYIECIDAEDLKALITSDTTKYKIVVFYSVCCGPCMRHFEETYSPAYNKYSDSINFYFINYKTGGVRYAREHLEQYGLFDGKALCFLDLENPDFHYDNIQYLNNIANYVFDSEPKINGNFGTPCEFIISKDNNVLKQLTTTPTSGSAFTTMQLWQIEIDKINEINFDSIYRQDIEFDLFNELPVCTDEHCPIF